jgi:hypothetical protein
MKKAFVFVLLLILLLLCSCTSKADEYGGGIVLYGDMPSPTNLSSCYANEDIVYVTKSGKKYHKEGCSYLKSSKIMMSLEQAVMEGKEPCSKCFGGNND